ncbi:MAG: hypothetical protein ACJ73N_06005, partial [Bryobacteraceae bacterium]
MDVKSGSRPEPPNASDVFLNVPYDQRFLDLFLAYVAGLGALGLFPRATLEIPGGERRLDRIFTLIRACASSLHDLSRVELDERRPMTPRFNMPFELGLAVAWEKLEPGKHTWFVFETKLRRVEKSLSDLSGTDVYVHEGKPKGIFRELCNAFVRSQRQPDVEQMDLIYQGLKQALPSLLRKSGSQSVFQALVFS